MRWGIWLGQQGVHLCNDRDGLHLVLLSRILLGFSSRAKDNAEHWRKPHPCTCPVRFGIEGTEESIETSLFIQTPSFCIDESISSVWLSTQCPIPWKQGDKHQIAVSFCSFQAIFLVFWGQLLLLQRGNPTKWLKALSKHFLDSGSFGAYEQIVWIDEKKCGCILCGLQ